MAKKPNACPGGSPMPHAWPGYQIGAKKADARTFGQDLMRGEHNVGAGAGEAASGTSIFDPVLCELAYRWFCPVGGKVLDPFAGGSVRGIVAGALGYEYHGIELRAEQVAANEKQADEIATIVRPRWINGDSRNCQQIAPGHYDMVFSCPPYADLERYSDDPNDLSTLEYDQFVTAYREIIARACGMLKPNRFAMFVVGDLRDRQGFYRGFVSDTIAAFEDCGMQLYNEAILVTAVGSLPIRVGRQFAGYRKLGKTHQNVLVFYGGDPKQIPKDFGTVDVYDPFAVGKGGKTVEQAIASGDIEDGFRVDEPDGQMTDDDIPEPYEQ